MTQKQRIRLSLIIQATAGNLPRITHRAQARTLAFSFRADHGNGLSRSSQRDLKRLIDQLADTGTNTKEILQKVGSILERRSGTMISRKLKQQQQNEAALQEDENRLASLMNEIEEKEQSIRAYAKKAAKVPSGSSAFSTYQRQALNLENEMKLLNGSVSYLSKKIALSRREQLVRRLDLETGVNRKFNPWTIADNIRKTLTQHHKMREQISIALDEVQAATNIVTQNEFESESPITEGSLFQQALAEFQALQFQEQVSSASVPDHKKIKDNASFITETQYQ